MKKKVEALSLPAILKFNWSVSRAYDTQGYNVCTLRANGRKVGNCNGGGYDLQGTALAEFVMGQYGKRLVKIKDRAGSVRVENTNPERNVKSDSLYGLNIIVHADGRLKSLWIDGGCGFGAVCRIMTAIGLKMERMDRDLWRLTRCKHQ